MKKPKKSITPKRNYKSKIYTNFRKAVWKRDGGKCCLPGCKSRSKRFEVHHILRWADYPHLRYNVTNGILLHRCCHKKITGKEDLYVQLFLEIVNHNMLKRKKEQSGVKRKPRKKPK